MASSPQSDSSKQSGKGGSLGDVSPERLENAPLMMTADELAETLCISKRQVWRLKAKGDIPKPVKIGTSVRWRRGDILEWIAADCPAASSLLNTILYQLVYRPTYAIISLFVRG